MSDIIKTNTIPHLKFTIPIPWNKKCGKNVTYYIGDITSEGIRSGGRFQVHEKVDGNDEGYCGATLDFLMADGTTEKVKGPFYRHRDGNQRVLMDIIKELQSAK